MKNNSNKNKKEQQQNNKKDIQYKIFRIETDKNSGREKRITMIKFFAKNDNEAYNELKKYRKIANKIYKYYYGRVGGYSIKDDKGNLIEFDSFAEMMELNQKSNWYDFMVDFFNWISELKHRIKLAWQRATKKHTELEACGLFDHILDDLEYNLPIIAEDGSEHPVMTFLVEARKQMHKDDKNFNLQKSLDDNLKFSEEEHKLGSELMKQTILGLLEDIQAYRFFSSGGIIDVKNPKEVETSKKFSNMLPYIPGKYKEIDYFKLSSLKNKYRNRIFNH